MPPMLSAAMELVEPWSGLATTWDGDPSFVLLTNGFSTKSGAFWRVHVGHDVELAAPAEHSCFSRILEQKRHVSQPDMCQPDKSGMERVGIALPITRPSCWLVDVKPLAINLRNSYLLAWIALSQQAPSTNNLHVYNCVCS